MQRRDKIVLQKIISNIDLAIKFLGETSQEDFLNDELLQHAEAMVSIKIGELIKALTSEFREQHNQIEWKKAAGYRDIVAHRYESLVKKFLNSTQKKIRIWQSRQLPNPNSQILISELVRSAGIEPTLSAPEANVLSTGLRAQNT